MKRITKLLIIQMLIVPMMMGAMYHNAMADSDGTKSVSASGTKPLTPGPLLDDFRYSAPINIWGALAGTFSSSATVPPPADAKCEALYTSDSAIAYGGTGYSLKLNYNVSAVNSYAGYYSNLGSAPLSGYTAVSFYVKGSSGGEFFKIQLKNSSTTRYHEPADAYQSTAYFRNIASVYITDYHPDGGVTTSWRKVTIPFDNFVNLDGLASMLEFDIVFENAQSMANASPAQGTIYIDNITFETGTINTVRIDHFGHKGKDASGNDKPGADALGGNIGTTLDKGTINVFADATNYSPYVYGMRLEYNVSTSGAWAGSYFVFGGGNTDNTVEHPEKGGWIAIPHDFSAYNWITLRVKAKSDAENPIEMKVELLDDTGTTKFVLLNPITTSWASYPIPMSNFVGLDKTRIKQMTFVFVGNDIGSQGGSKSGAVFVDSVQFER